MLAKVLRVALGRTIFNLFILVSATMLGCEQERVRNTIDIASIETILSERGEPSFVSAGAMLENGLLTLTDPFAIDPHGIEDSVIRTDKFKSRTLLYCNETARVHLGVAIEGVLLSRDSDDPRFAALVASDDGSALIPGDGVQVDLVSISQSGSIARRQHGTAKRLCLLEENHSVRQTAN